MRRGECKTPGGKLAAVELCVDGEKLADVRVVGDFFLHPEAATAETLDSLAAALTGCPADLDVNALAARVRAAVPFGVELVGTSPRAIAAAVRRAVTGDDAADPPPPQDRVGSFTPAEIESLTLSWKSLPWRLIPEIPQSAAMNVALDEVLTDAVAAGTSPPTLRLWRWTEQAVIVGRCQAVKNEVDADAAKAMGVTVVRRMTGGGAMFLQPHGAVTYSLSIPEPYLAGLSIRQSYEVCEAWVIAALRGLGVDAHHVPINDIACSDGKIGGAAQARRRGVVLHHTTLAYDMDPGEMVKVLRIGREKLLDKAVTSAAKRVSPLARQTGVSRQYVADALLDHFRKTFGGTLSELTPEEVAAAEALVTSKYASDTWTYCFG